MSALWDRGITPSPLWTRGDLILVAVLTLVGLCVRLPGLNQGLWFDEILTLVRYARLPAIDIVNQLNSLNNHIFYSLCAHFCMTWFGESAWALRLPSLVFGVATIPAVYYLARQLARRDEAVLAALFLTLNFTHVYYSQNARGYSGLLLGAVLATIFFIRLMATPNPQFRWILAYAITAAFSVWLHLTATFVIAVHGLIWGVLAFKRVRRGMAEAIVAPGTALLLTGMISAVLYAPILYGLFVSQSEHGLSVSGNGTSFFIGPSDVTAWVVGEFLHGLTRSMPGDWLFIGTVTASLVAGVVSYYRQSIVAVSLMFLPTITTAVAIVASDLLFFPRFMFNSAAFLMLLCVRGGFVLAAGILPFISRRQVFFIGIVLAFVGTSMVPAAWQPKQDYTAAANFVVAHRQSGDGVACIHRTSYTPLATYLGLDCDLVENVAGIEEFERTHARTWVLFTFPDSMKSRQPELWTRLHNQSEYQLVRAFKGSLHGGTVYVLLGQSGG